MREFKSYRRLKKIEETIKTRQPSLRVVIENVHDPHNVSAILRTCDAVGVPKISLLYTIEKFPKLSRTSSSSAVKWIDKEKFSSVNECYDALKKEGYEILVSRIDKESKSIYDIDLTGKVALVFGNENRGVSENSMAMADGAFYIPMTGMVQSLNVSVAAAVTLYEAYRQRKVKGCYDQSEMTEDEIQNLIDEWCRR